MAAGFLERLPRGRTLPPDVWATRHRIMVQLVWLHALGLFLFALAATVALTACSADTATTSDASTASDGAAALVCAVGTVVVAGVLGVRASELMRRAEDATPKAQVRRTSARRLTPKASRQPGGE